MICLFQKALIMTTLGKQASIYIPLIEGFVKDTKSLHDHLWIDKKGDVDLSGIFIPHTLPDYDNADLKIFYVGQDTYYWTSLNNVYCMDAKSYLENNNKWPPSIDTLLDWRNPYTFWHFVNRIQLAFNGLKYSNLNNLDNTQRRSLSQIGWGNIFSLEILDTIKKYDDEIKKNYGVKLTEIFDKKIYAKMLEYTKKISKLKNIIDVYSPDYVIILAWKFVEDWFWEGLDYQYIENESIDSLLSCYRLRCSNAKVLWTYHPQALCRKRQNLDELIKIMLDRK